VGVDRTERKDSGERKAKGLEMGLGVLEPSKKTD
jgi:hypothetical protein